MIEKQNSVDIAEILGIAPRTVRELQQRDVLPRKGTPETMRKAHAKYQATRKASTPAAEAKARLVAAQADLAEVKLAETRKELVPATEIEAAWSAIVRDAKAALLGCTAKVQARLGHLTAHDAGVIDSEIRAALQSLSESGRV